LGLTTKVTDENARAIEAAFTLLPDDERIHREWRRLVMKYSVMGAKVHDARLVAAMHVHRVTHLLTLNERDFVRYDDIQVVHPRQLAGTQE
jgi:predicted nucleic acid-binding protein